MKTLNAEQASSLLFCSAKQVEDLARDGKLPGVKLGRSWIFPETVLIEYISQQSWLNLKKEAKNQTACGKYPVL